MQTLEQPSKNRTTPLLWAAAGGFLFILIAAFGGVIQHYFSGDDFFVYHYANNLPDVQAWQRYFYENGRLIESLYWTYQYKLLGYNPLLEHSFSFGLLLITAIVASACFLNAWPQRKRSKALPYLFVFLLFLNWVSTSTVFRIPYDNGRISLIFFFLAGLALQRWAAEQRGRWLLLSFAFFWVSVLTYENTAFLFPALLLLAWPLLPVPKKGSARRRLLLFVGLAAVSGLILLIPYWLYSYIALTQGRTMEHPAMVVDIGDLPMNVLGAGPAVYLRFGQFANFETFPLNLLMAVGLLLILALASIWIVHIHRGPILKRIAETKSRWTCIYLASLWFLIFGPVPYILLDYPVSGRVYSSAVFGLFPLLLMVYETTNKQLLRIMAVALILLFAGFCLFDVVNQSTRFNRAEAALNMFYRGLKDAVPYVEAHTVFIIINGPLENAGCGPSLEMLYDQDDLKCGLLSSTLDKYHAIRHSNQFETSSGTDWEQHLRGQNWILITVNNNVPTVLEELEPGDFDLLITWESAEPIRTDYNMIVTKELPPPSAFYLHLLQRAKALFPQ